MALTKLCSKMNIATIDRIESINDNEIVLILDEEFFTINFKGDSFYSENIEQDLEGLITETVSGTTIDNPVDYLKNTVPAWVCCELTFSDGQKTILGSIQNPVKMNLQTSDSLVSISISHDRVNI